MKRELEPELMDDPEESQAYDDMDHAEVNRAFVSDLLAGGPLVELESSGVEGAHDSFGNGAEVLDLGTGTARIPIELCRQDEHCRILASDAAISMLEIAKINVAVEGFEHRIQLHHGDSKQLGFADDMFDVVISNSLIHHLEEPQRALSEIVRVVRPGGRIFVRDLFRPDSPEQVENLVGLYAGAETEECQQLFRQSLIAALTVAEWQEMVAAMGLDPAGVAATSDRHVTWDAIKPVD